MTADSLIQVSNKGQAIASTNYFDCAHAASGLFYLTWNAGAGRLLLPDNQKRALTDMRSAKFVIVSSGPWVEQGRMAALELLFEDHSDSPFVLTIPLAQSDRQLPETDQGGGFYISVWTRGGQKLRLPGRYRKVESLPCLAEWKSH
jgi:hypothetical protein